MGLITSWLQKFHDKLSLMDYPITQRTSILEQTLKESKGSTLSFILKTCCACCDSNAEKFILCRQWMNLRSVKLQFAQWSICLYIRTTPVDWFSYENTNTVQSRQTCIPCLHKGSDSCVSCLWAGKELKIMFILAGAEICWHVGEINLNQDRPNPILITSHVILYPGGTLEQSKVVLFRFEDLDNHRQT